MSFEAIVTQRSKVVHLSLETNVTHSGHLWCSFLISLNLSRWYLSDSTNDVVIKASVCLRDLFLPSSLSLVSPTHLIFLKETVILFLKKPLFWIATNYKNHVFQSWHVQIMLFYQIFFQLCYFTNIFLKKCTKNKI
jgi:hypothetical protein